MLVFATACGMGELQEGLQGDWAYESSDEEQARETAFEQILSDSPPMAEELAEMGLVGQDLIAAQETLSLRMIHSDSLIVTELRREFEQVRDQKREMRLRINGDRLSLSTGGRILNAQFVVESESAGDLRIRTTDANGAQETQVIVWHDENRFTMTDPEGRTLRFVRE